MPVKPYEGQLKRRKRELARMRKVQVGSNQFCTGEIVARTIAALEADIARLSALASETL